MLAIAYCGIFSVLGKCVARRLEISQEFARMGSKEVNMRHDEFVKSEKREVEG